ncbi:4'-phosphopantetheinyl transferase superfamily protein [Aquimarina sp. TRL1]|uniref:type I polyketide synthase n=1 Tax=Aquimarina sp. (strain TRL1) TaxID=2736252 RepID=UPI00158C92A1|nr:type I polyketide synthase [Aquimarina sp. TRL1]QKX03645.1 4'-phosphopantetheinyl transferase superfamily protein [Aquimarina sp. TRL1]
MTNKTDIAIVGMSCVFPGAGDIDTFWSNIINKVDAITEVPDHRWDKTYYDPSSSAIDRFYCKRGGFVDEFAAFDPVAFGILPIAVEGMDPDHLLSLKMAKKALDDAGVFEKNIALDKAGIILGKGNYPGIRSSMVSEKMRTGEHLVTLLKTVLPDIAPSELIKVKETFLAQTGRYGADTTMGLIPNLVASLIANRLDFGGTAYTVDAACASSLIAIDHAVRELNSGRCDLVLAGGIHLCQNESFYSLFTQLGALSRKQQIRPFDKEADGLVIGEGCGMVVLKKMEKALADNDRIYAVIKGVGIASDGAGTSLMSPSVSGQTKAIEQAWENAGVDKTNIGYIEAHGTATVLGDKTEITTLKQVFGEKEGTSQVGLGTVKSMIGHTMPASGIAGVIKTALALYHEKQPPTLHCDEPLDILSGSKFSILQEEIDWKQSDTPRYAGINAFGFGGINAHVVLEGGDIAKKQNASQIESNIEKDPVLLLKRTSGSALIHALENEETELGRGDHRIVLFNPTPERIKKAIKIIKRGRSWRNRNDIWYTSTPLLQNGEKVCFLFPGLDGLEDSTTEDVCRYFDIPALTYQKNTELVGSVMSVFACSIILDTALKKMNITPDVIAGHSLGEWVGYMSSGICEKETTLQTLSEQRLSSISVPDVFFLVVGCGLEKVRPIIEGIKDIYLSHDNCHHQIILCGKKYALDICKRILDEAQIFNQVLPFQSGFHSPFFQEYAKELEDINVCIQNAPRIPIWSATTVAPYPDDIEGIKELSVDNLLKPVRFRELTQKLYEEGARVFIQIGGGGLIGFTDDILKGKQYSGISASSTKRTGINQIQRVIAALFVEGREEGISFLNRIEKEVKNKEIKLALGQTLIKDFGDIKIPSNYEKRIPTHEKVTHKHPVLKQFQENFESIQKAQLAITEVLEKQLKTAGEKHHYLKLTDRDTVLTKEPIPEDFSKTIEISLTKYPELKDHAMYEQREGWIYPEDFFPVVPMTMLIEIMAESVLEQTVAKKIIAIGDVQAFKWMEAASPVHITLSGTWKDANNAVVSFGEYATATITIGDEYKTPPYTKIEDLGEERPAPLTEKQVYEERHMFHGEAYQGIRQFLQNGTKGMSALISGGTGKGSLLDNAGQLFGLWCHWGLSDDYVAFPMKIRKIQFFDDFLKQDGIIKCVCRLEKETDEILIAKMILYKGDQVWATITGWQNKRLGFDAIMSKTYRSIRAHKLSDEILPGISLFHGHYKRVTAWGYVMRRYLNSKEKEVFNSLKLSQQRSWLMGKVAIKDAVCKYIADTTGNQLFPGEITVHSDPSGKPYVTGEGNELEGIHVSLSHKEKLAVATVSSIRNPGIDLEEIKDRGEGFIAVSFHEQEVALLSEKEAYWEWITRGWSAKEAYGKSMGIGLGGAPKKIRINEIKDERIKIEDTWIQTKRYKNYIIAWIK